MSYFKNIPSRVRFSIEKMQKVNLFETRNFFCDIYCLEPGQIQKAHTHNGADKIYFVLEGQGTIQIGNEEKIVKKNEICLAKSGLVHGVKNSSDERLTLLVFMAPNPNI
ncbi:cupin domain-containing protein [candidate division KSB1 bacterium]|nr:cupin domain-containing protein [candidate division KSB1 bacterium]TDI94804.1 MAG: cupin domain-containing protein [Caldithrix sp.]